MSELETYVHPFNGMTIPIRNGKYHVNSNVLWWTECVKKYPQFFQGKIKVLEMGSAVIKPYKKSKKHIGSGATASLRDFFGEVLKYVGVDWRDNEYVDAICLAHEYDDEDKFDTIVSASMLEHDPYWARSIDNMCRLLKPEGMLILTWGAALNKEHCLEEAPDEGFHNLKAGLVLKALQKNGMWTHEFRYECNFPWRDVSYHVGKDCGEVVLVAFNHPRYANGERIIEPTIKEDTVTRDEFVAAYNECYGRVVS